MIEGCSKKYGNKESLTESSVCGISITYSTPLNSCLTLLSLKNTDSDLKV